MRPMQRSRTSHLGSADADSFGEQHEIPLGRALLSLQSFSTTKVNRRSLQIVQTFPGRVTEALCDVEMSNSVLFRDSAS